VPTGGNLTTQRAGVSDNSTEIWPRPERSIGAPTLRPLTGTEALLCVPSEARRPCDCVASFGFRGVVRHRVAGNWVKGYDTASVLRVDTTINNLRELRMPRVVSDSDRRRERRLCPMRKGVSDLWRRTSS
jgi:hypothetical protein